MIKIKSMTKARTSGNTLSRGTATHTTVVTATEAEYATRAGIAQTADRATRADAADQSTYAEKSGQAALATFANKAADISADSETLAAALKNYLYKAETDESQTVEGEVQFKKDTTFLSDIIVDRIHDAKSTESDRTIIGAEGFDLYMGTDGKSHLYVDYLTARTRFFAASAEIRKVSYSGGTTLFSNAGSKIVKVAYVYDEAGEKVVAYKCYAAADDGETQTMNWWKVGMMALCQTFNVKENSTSENLQNRYYWRLVVATGQETLDDGKLYDYVVLSNVATFQGNESNVPIYTKSIFANENVIKLSWAGLLLAVTQKNGMGSFAARVKEDLDLDNDEGGNKIATRTYYGYEDGSDAPLPGDVIVQAGDQVRWQSYGNVIKLTTSTDDNGSDVAPSITLYHNMGKTDGTTSPWLWQTVTAVINPEKVYFNANRFVFFVESIDGETISIVDVNNNAKQALTRYTELDGKVSEQTESIETLQGKVSEQTESIGILQDDVAAAQSSADDANEAAEKADKKADAAQTAADKANNTIADLPIKNKDDVTKYQSEVIQTARNISLSVSSAVTGRVNMLQNTACRKMGEGWAYMSGGGAHTDGRPYEQIETLTGMAGRNCLHVRTYSTLGDQGEITGGVIAGFRWQGNTPQGNVSLAKGKTYVLSWWARSATPDNVSVVGEVIMESSRSDTSRPQGYCPSGYEAFCKSYEAKSGWTLYTQVFTVPTDCPVDWFEINIFLRSKDTTLREGYLALPCLEETDEYHGWSSNSDDYDYVGGNILDGASTFTVAGNLTTASDVTEKGYLNETSVAHASHPETQEGDFTEVLAWRGGLGIENQGDYTLSFLAKGSGEVTSYLYCVEDNNSSLWVENSDGYYMENVTDGGNNMRLTSDWKRYWVHWHVHSDIIPTMVIIRCSKGNEVYVTQPKLEKGATMTAWTEKKTDLVDKQALKKAGIDIDANQVTLYGDTVKVKNGDTTAALFEKGKIKADYLNAETIVTNGFKGQTIDAKNATINNLNVTGQLNSGTLGPFNISESGLDFVNGAKAYYLYNDHFVFTDQSVPATLYGGLDSTDKMKISVATSSHNSSVTMKVGSYGTGVYCLNEEYGYKTYCVPGKVEVVGTNGNVNAFIDCQTNARLLISAGLKWFNVVATESGGVNINIQGLPTSPEGLSAGDVYIINGFLRIVQ